MGISQGIYRYVSRRVSRHRPSGGTPRLNPANNSGFTLTEILVSMIIAGLVMSGLLGLMVELLTSDARETARTETQREMQMALDYISSDIRESVYVYDGDCMDGETDSCDGFVNAISRDNSVPVLAFWKLEDLPKAVVDNHCSGGGQAPLDVPCLSGRSYSLIVYYLTRNEENDATWSGLGRLQRARLATFTSQGGPNFTPPYAPVEEGSGDKPSTFQKWQPDNMSAFQVTTLVDFVDSRPLDEIGRSQGTDEPSVGCPDGHIITPSDDTLNANGFGEVRNFYACIRDDSIPADDDDDENATSQTFNQKVILFLRGNAAGKPGIRDANIGFMPAIQTQVLNRSVREKTPRNF
ncbi:MAG: pseudopilin HpsC [Phormidium sp. OSCR]|nr:MAG: pseudopilin HpsC [Phormidium sp. OSCR]